MSETGQEQSGCDNVEGNHEGGETSSSVILGRCCRCCHRWPRTALFFVGVVFPLWILMMNCLLWGYFLALLEAPEEVRRNNDALVVKRQAAIGKDIATNATNAIPGVCFDLFFYDNETDLLLLLESKLPTAPFPPRDPLSDDLVVNATEMQEFLRNCTATALPIATELVNEAIEATIRAAEQSLSFNWVRCSTQRGTSLHKNISSLRLPAQTEFYTDLWESSRSQLQTQYLQEYLENSTLTPAEALVDASRRALHDATGDGDDCRPNAVASAWFFFTVMTTVGYGNQSPSTPGGRIMVYTVGFISILMFGLLLIVSGAVVSTILDDTLRRRRNASPGSVGGIAWGSISIAWMIILAAYTEDWKHVRLGDDASSFDLREGYWFAFITSTTVGLGDIFIEPEVILFRDLLVLTLLVLISFTLFSAFLSKLCDIWSPKGLTWFESLKASLVLDNLEESSRG